MTCKHSCIHCKTSKWSPHSRTTTFVLTEDTDHVSLFMYRTDRVLCVLFDIKNARRYFYYFYLIHKRNDSLCYHNAFANILFANLLIIIRSGSFIITIIALSFLYLFYAHTLYLIISYCVCSYNCNCCQGLTRLTRRGRWNFFCNVTLTLTIWHPDDWCLVCMKLN